MKSIVFDTGPIISLALNNLLWVVKELKDKYKGDFFIPEAVRYELIDKPLSTKKFKLEAHHVSQLIHDGTLTVINDQKVTEFSKKIANLANNSFHARDHAIPIVHDGELETIACSLSKKSESIVVDERTTRYLIEEPENITKLLERKLHTKIKINQGNLKKLKKELSSINVIRSIELVTIGYKLNLFSKLELDSKENKKELLLDALLWAMKLNGCAVREEEIETIMKTVLRK